MQKIKKSGLPEALQMRHDEHFVDLISTSPAGPRIRIIPLAKIDPNPHQARTEVGNIQELVDSIKKRGVLEPILVRPIEDRFEIIAGERRYMASKAAGLTSIPCIEMDVHDQEAMEIALIENLQRKDLDVFEEADGLQALADLYSYSHQEIADKIGKARSTITEILSITRIPEPIRLIIKDASIFSRTMILEVARQATSDDMLELVKQITERKLTREDTRDLSKLFKGKTKKIKYFVYNFLPEDTDSFRMRLEFKKKTVSKMEIIEVLEQILVNLKTDIKKAD